jgi:hypothetical protein
MMNKNRNNLVAGNANNLNNSNYHQSYRLNDRIINNDVNPFNHFQGIGQDYGENNFDSSFTPKRSVLEKVDTRNQDNTIHNNLRDNLQKEAITEYVINIDSIDRDISVYPSPYAFTVNFNTIASTKKQVKTIVNGKQVYTEEYFKGTSAPTIDKEFRNVRYIKLTDIILPQFGNICQHDDGHYIFDSGNKLVDDRYIILGIEEFSDSLSRVYNTYDASDNRLGSPVSFCQIYPDTRYGKNFYYGGIIGGVRTYKENNLGSINKLTIRLYDSCGNPLIIDNLFGPCELKCNNSCDPRNPLNKRHQIFMSFTIGVVETELATLVKYEK